jgi:hypothetical protein
MVTLKWEKVEGSVTWTRKLLEDDSPLKITRAKVPGGWLVRENKGQWYITITFVPDPKNEWR